MLFLKLLIVAYCIVSILAVLMAISAVDKKGFRLVFIVLGLAMPIIFVYAVVASIFSPRRAPRFNEEMARIEDDIENERIRIFGGERTCPSFSDHWQHAYQLYLEQLVRNAASASQKVAELGSALQHHGKAA
jgi:cbb3-type cytochrome oxidase subunit 3